MTLNELSNKLTQEELISWAAYYELKNEYEVKDKSRAGKR